MTTTTLRRRGARVARPEATPCTAAELRPAHDDRAASTSREHELFEALGPDSDGTIALEALPEALWDAGLRPDDPRFAESMRLLAGVRAAGRGAGRLDAGDFARIVRPNILLVEQALTRRLVIPEFGAFTDDLRAIWERVAPIADGAVADYIPQLGRVSPQHFALGLCTIDGQRFSLGDATVPFCLQSTSKPITYALALEERGEAVVHAHIGCEPSGVSFNALTLNRHGRPHNPLINAGAIMASALVRPDASAADRFDHVMTQWQRLAGGVRPGFANATYLSERRTADRNFALGYFMREMGAFPDGVELVDALEFYFQCCSIECNADALGTVAATLANGGVCPLTGERVLRQETVRKVLSLMTSCGMYDFSGEWAFRVGLPAKSGVSGAILVVVPNVLGYCVWSPRLDAHGNSVRGVAFSEELVRTFNFHNFDNLVGEVHGKRDPRLRRGEGARSRQVDLYWAASEGDLTGIRRLAVRGVDLEAPDYDGRTALHLAASEGRLEVVAWLLAQGVHAGPRDRWGNTPADDAARGGHARIVALLDERPRRLTEGPADA